MPCIDYRFAADTLRHAVLLPLRHAAARCYADYATLLFSTPMHTDFRHYAYAADAIFDTLFRHAPLSLSL